MDHSSSSQSVSSASQGEGKRFFALVVQNPYALHHDSLFLKIATISTVPDSVHGDTLFFTLPQFSDSLAVSLEVEAWGLPILSRSMMLFATDTTRDSAGRVIDTVGIVSFRSASVMTSLIPLLAKVDTARTVISRDSLYLWVLDSLLKQPFTYREVVGNDSSTYSIFNHPNFFQYDTLRSVMYQAMLQKRLPISLLDSLPDSLAKATYAQLRYTNIFSIAQPADSSKLIFKLSLAQVDSLKMEMLRDSVWPTRFAQVNLDKDTLLVARTEVTQGEFKAQMGANFNPSPASMRNDNFPISGINIYEAMLYCNAASKSSGITDTVFSYKSITTSSGRVIDVDSLVINLKAKGYRMASRSEWLAFLRKGRLTSSQPYWGAANSDLYAITSLTSSSASMKAVGILLPTPLGIYDLQGNVSEFTVDRDSVGVLKQFYAVGTSYTTTKASELVDTVGILIDPLKVSGSIGLRLVRRVN